MTQSEKNNFIKQVTNWLTPMYDVGLTGVYCAICHKFETFPNVECDIDSVVNHLIANDWSIVNDNLYCSECRKQYDSLQNIIQQSIRPSKISYYLNIAKEVSTRATCLRRKYGAVLIKNDVIIATGYNGSPRGTKNCIDMGECRREKLNIPRGQCYEMCRSLHAEQNCIINASRNDMIDSDLYLYGINVDTNDVVNDLDSCQLCKKMIINAGIKRVIFARPNNQYEVKDVSEWVVNDETLTNKFGY